MPDFKTDTIAKLKTMTLDEVIDFTAAQGGDNWTHSAGMAEIARRQTESQIKAAQAQREAAEAEKTAAEAATAAAAAETKAASAAAETAAATKKNSLYMLWSVIFAALSAFISLVSTVWTNWPKK
jgi:hypothetical protein